MPLLINRVTESEVERVHPANTISGAALVEQIKREVVVQVRSATAQEYTRAREWFLTHAMPKAIRVAQRSAYDVLRSYGVLSDPRPGGRDRSPGDSREVGKHIVTETIPPRILTDEEVNEMAESCVALLVTQGQAIELFLSEMSVKARGFLLPEDAPKVRVKAEVLNCARVINQNPRREGNDL